LLSRLDLLAIGILLLGFGIIGIAAGVMLVMEAARILGTLWAQPHLRWLFLTLGLAVAWLAARWKHYRS
jgi:hypothetical protein